MENSSLIVEKKLSYDSIENLLEYAPDNVFSPYLEKQWISINDNYSKFQIATWGSLICHEVSTYRNFI